VSRPDNFPDALAAGPLAGKETAPLFLASSTQVLGPTATNGITAYPNSGLLHRGTLLGSDAVLGPVVAANVATAIATQS
jgi:hypothetical protein